MRSFWCSSKKVTVCSTSRANLSVLSSFREILATETSGNLGKFYRIMTEGPSLMFLKILAHPVFTNLNFHMPMIVDLSHPIVVLTGENGSGKSTLQIGRASCRGRG